jgi:hypothetical protein
MQKLDSGTNKYKVFQVYESVKDVYLTHKLETPEYITTIEATSAQDAITRASRLTNIIEICLHAEKVEEPQTGMV